MQDKLTNVLFCNPDDYDLIKEALEKQKGFYKLIKTPAIEKGKVVLVKDEKVKMDILQWQRFVNEMENINNADT